MTKNYTTKQYWKNLWRLRFLEQFRRDELPEKRYLTLAILTLELDVFRPFPLHVVVDSLTSPL